MEASKNIKGCSNVINIQFIVAISGVNFNHILRAAFACTDPESTEKTDNLTIFFFTFAMFAFKSCS
jgi:hypothetical protein